MNEGCRVRILFSSPSRNLFLFLIYLSNASEKVQTVCLVYQSTICLCFNNYTVSCKITLQMIIKFCLQTALLCSSMQNLHRLVGMAPYLSNAPHFATGSIDNFRGETCNTFSVFFECKVPNKTLILTPKSVLQSEGQILSDLSEAPGSLTKAELTTHDKY